ncbi:hypothetical protein A2311_05660 [candidate division WOR-1 bacterium RIFOXYB2_FULL_48_7]|uniref:VIT family protein n=1 Tax=candidate division WOR-1 bacterium RIFOXYB2_FULL_48_7 TaxID=1802583 RepID=A0A1F4TPH8_UNCSA|nr:MAG: hypothetical protein A2311_05660 [candidate division WOR-1 bacterium RIFOXYB2_FULL_48_7]
MELNDSQKTGFSFGLTSAIVTTLGLMVGLNSGTHSKLVVIGGILTIAIADAFSDALGIHISEEAEEKHSTAEIWTSTLMTFFTKFFFALTFLVAIVCFELSLAVIINIVYGLTLLGIFSYYIGRGGKTNPWMVVYEHVLIALVVIFVTNFVGGWISQIFG